MGLACTFALNRRNLSQLVCPGVGSFAAFSGRADGRNNPAAVDKVYTGPLPPGRYYIVDRRSGGRLGWLWDWEKRHLSSTDHSYWFSLYRDDGLIDDETIVNGVHRGNFRLHPIGPLGLSEGCITIIHPADFTKLHDALKAGATVPITRGGVAYGTVDVH